MVDADSSLPLAKGTLRVIPQKDTNRVKVVLADTKGFFEVTDLNPGNYTVSFSFTGFDPAEKAITITNASVDLGEVLMFRKLKTLGDVTVVGRTPPARQKGDTTELNASAFKVNPDASAEDLIKKAPGITVENGQVTAQGEQVRRVTIDGRTLFGDDATAALKNLPAEIVDKIQVFDRLSDQAQLTGVDDGNSEKSINIVTKANMRNGQFGRIYAGYGTNDRYATGGNVNIFTGSMRLNLIGLFNNVNQQNFSGEDLLGVSGAANQGRGGGGRGGGGGFRGGGGNFAVGPQPGIAKTNAAGINYSDQWLDKKMEVSGSYFFNNSNTRANSETNRERFLSGDTSQFYKERRLNQTENVNHRFNMRLEYKMDSNNTLILSPRVSFQNNRAFSNTTGANTNFLDQLINNTQNTRQSNTEGYNLSNDLTYRHAFAKRGRSISISVNTEANRRNSEINLDASSGFVKTGILELDTIRQKTDNLTNGYSLGGNLAWTEPVGKNGVIQLNYNPRYTNNKADQANNFFDKDKASYTIFDSTLSNKFNNTVMTQNAGLSYRLGDRENQFSVGMNFQQTELNSDQVFPITTQVNKQFTNWLPNLQYRKNFTKQSNLRVFYRTSVNQPSVNQLQNVINNSNPLFINTGNPFLNQSYTHFIATRFNATNTIKGRSFFAGVFYQQASDYITNGIFLASKDSLLARDIVLNKGAQLSKPINLSGYRTLRSFINWGFAIRPLKSNLNLSAGLNYGRTPGQLNGVNNYSNSFTYNLGATLASNISEYVDFNLNYSANFSQVKNTLQPLLNNKYYFHSAGLKINLLSTNGWFILNDIANQQYSGLADGFNQSFWLWNVSGGKKFLKDRRGEVKLTVFDLLKQNQSISRNVGDGYIEDVQTDVLQQYFMLTFTYTLRNFGSGASSRNSRAD